MESRTVSAEAIVQWNKWLSARNRYVDDFRVRLMKNVGRHLDEEDYGSSEYEEPEDDSED